MFMFYYIVLKRMSTELDSIHLSGVFPRTLLNELHRLYGEIGILIGLLMHDIEHDHLLVMENCFEKKYWSLT